MAMTVMVMNFAILRRFWLRNLNQTPAMDGLS
jgi:hypothetical protein